MTQTAFKTSVTLFALAVLSACATHERPKQLSAETQQCRHSETMTCDRFANENYNCTCQKGSNLGDMLDAYRLPDF